MADFQFHQTLVWWAHLYPSLMAATSISSYNINLLSPLFAILFLFVISISCRGFTKSAWWRAFPPGNRALTRGYHANAILDWQIWRTRKSKSLYAGYNTSLRECWVGSKELGSVMTWLCYYIAWYYTASAASTTFIIFTTLVLLLLLLILLLLLLLLLLPLQVPLLPLLPLLSLLLLLLLLARLLFHRLHRLHYNWTFFMILYSFFSFCVYSLFSLYLSVA